MDLSVNVSLLAAVALLTLMLVVSVIFLWARQNRLLHRYRTLLNGTSNQNLEDLLIGQAAEIERLNQQVKSLAGELERQGKAALHHVQRVGVVRFNAFADTGSDLSFAIALLDANSDGVVLSSLYARSESRTYAKPSHNGKSTYALSDEEREAISKALSGSYR